MKRFVRVAAFLCLILVTSTAIAQTPTDYTRQEDVIYGRKYGIAMTMDVFTPKQNANGLGVVFVVSGGWFSSHDNINGIVAGLLPEPIKRGYTVFAVCHGSQPKFTIPEILLDMHRALRYIRYHAKDYKIDPDRIGITGASAGGHLSLMQGTAGNAGNADAKDPVDKVSSRVQAVACFFPPTDFLNYGESGKRAGGEGVLKAYRPPFDFHEMSKEENRFERITDEKKFLDIVKDVSPIYHISSDTPPTLIIHGDADNLVPIQQAKIFLEKLKAAGVQCELVTKPS